MEQVKKKFFKKEPNQTAEQLRAEVLVEINANKVRINKEEFVKTAIQKAELKFIKRVFGKLQKNTVEYNRSLNNILTSFSKCNTPNWGGLVFNGQRV